MGTASNVWHATASFKEAGEIARDLRSGFKGRRDESNIHSRQCFHGDLDCGEAKPYLRFDHAKAALGWAIAKLGLPSPILVSSGNGLHFYFALTEPITDMRALASLCRRPPRRASGSGPQARCPLFHGPRAASAPAWNAEPQERQAAARHRRRLGHRARRNRHVRAVL